MDNKIEYKGLCISSVEVHSRKSNSDFVVSVFLVQSDETPFLQTLELISNAVIADDKVTKMSDLEDGSARFGKVVLKKVVYQRKVQLRLESFELVK